ncbi:hypothetical protein [Micromonospora sp. NBC_01796]|uniref:hypothetical protein n=1 Tax=Micromonospora sp. NBC_01796 TaxID=2975987 RepID=UPI002DD9A6F3|nr:hypothetical protein [Micromonospora sp. NBC_01796]WSA86471.1 hypothetical protein OIE47_02275 [Micromonospora sp. NBC_01796]
MSENESRSGRRPARYLVVSVLVGVAALLTVGFVAVRDRPEDAAPADVITGVDWARTVIDLPTDSGIGCPTGRQHLQPVVELMVPSGFAWAPADEDRGKLLVSRSEISYGDLTGDGVPEAVLNVRCGPLSAHDLRNDLPGGRLLVVTMRADHSLAGLGFAGQPGARHLSFEVADGALVAEVWYAQTERGISGPSLYAPPHSRSYRWDGARFVQAAGRTAPLSLISSAESEQGMTGSAVQLATIMRDGKVVCPGRTVQPLTRTGDQFEATTDIRPVDLDHDGNGELLARVRCTFDGATYESLYLFGQGEQGFVTRDVPVANGGQYVIQDGWQVEYDVLTVAVRHTATGETTTHTMRWNGSTFVDTLGTYRN